MKLKTESLVAKYLEKIAVEKGLVIPETHKKVSEVAAKLNTLKPGKNLGENVIKLCNALRSQGFSKYADEVESKFLQYKTAQYNVVKETGDDLINGAHPEGSPKLPDMDGDSTIENILEQHKKIQQVINKQPTGKLAAKDAINIVRILLGQSIIDTKEIVKQVDMIKAKVDGLIEQMFGIASHKIHFEPNISDLFSHPLETIEQHKSVWIPLIGPALQLFNKWSTSIQDLKDKLNDDVRDFKSEINIENLNTIIARIDELVSLMSQMPVDQTVIDTKTKLIQKINEQRAALAGVKSMFQTKEEPTAQQSVQTPATDPSVQKVRDIAPKIEASTKLTADQKDQLVKTISKIRQDLNDPQKAPAARQALDRIEQQLTSKNLV